MTEARQPTSSRRGGESAWQNYQLDLHATATTRPRRRMSSSGARSARRRRKVDVGSRMQRRPLLASSLSESTDFTVAIDSDRAVVDALYRSL